ncbi:MAG: hypothetical protein M3Q10_13225, partial [Chloroflexota bacterium]|nr:hypothetical protein [Chloroflexota bacterium]
MERVDRLARYWVGFGRVPFVGPARIDRLVRHFGDLERAWTAPPGELRRVLDERAVASLLKTRAEFSLDAEMERIARAGVSVLTRA